MPELIEWKPEDGYLVIKLKFDKPLTDLRDPEAIRFMRTMHIITEKRVDQIFQHLIDCAKEMHDVVLRIDHPPDP